MPFVATTTYSQLDTEALLEKAALQRPVTGLWCNFSLSRLLFVYGNHMHMDLKRIVCSCFVPLLESIPFWHNSPEVAALGAFSLLNTQGDKKIHEHQCMDTS